MLLNLVDAPARLAQQTIVLEIRMQVLVMAAQQPGTPELRQSNNVPIVGDARATRAQLLGSLLHMLVRNLHCVPGSIKGY